MLSESSYLTAIYAYTGAACAIMLLLGLWLGKHWRAAWVVLVVLVAGALLLTPAYPKTGTTLAPALIVAGFEFMTAGYAGAQGALRPLAMTTGLAVLLSLLLGFTVLRRKAPVAGHTKTGNASTENASAPASKGTV